MRRITMLAVAALISGLALILIPASAEAARCHAESSSDTTSLYHGHVRGTVRYDVCRGDGDRWVVPKYVKGEYWGMGQGCGTFEVFKGVEFNFYMWAPNGANHNPGPFKVPCESDGNNTKVKDLNNVPRLYFDGGSPKWKANAEALLGWGTPNQSKTVSGKLDKDGN